MDQLLLRRRGYQRLGNPPLFGANPGQQTSGYTLLKRLAWEGEAVRQEQLELPASAREKSRPSHAHGTLGGKRTSQVCVLHADLFSFSRKAQRVPDWGAWKLVGHNKEPSYAFHVSGRAGAFMCITPQGILKGGT